MPTQSGHYLESIKIDPTKILPAFTIGLGTEDAFVDS